MEILALTCNCLLCMEILAIILVIAYYYGNIGLYLGTSLLYMVILALYFLVYCSLHMETLDFILVITNCIWKYWPLSWSLRTDYGNIGLYLSTC